VEEISAACREQDIGADQVNQAIQQLDKVIQQNTSAAEQMSATSEELAAQAEQLQASISFFRIGSDARVAGVARPRGMQAPAFQVQHSLAQKPARTAAPKAASVITKGRQPQPKERTPGAATVAGVALHLGNGANDAADDEFERY
jgi:methyl-accepting chemotaxis protein